MPREHSPDKPTTRRYSDTSVGYGERLAEIGSVWSIGSFGDSFGGSFGNALAETVNGYHKAELLRGPAGQQPWKTVEDVELATLGWVHRHNTARLHGYLGEWSPAEFEQAFVRVCFSGHAVTGCVSSPTVEPIQRRPISG